MSDLNENSRLALEAVYQNSWRDVAKLAVRMFGIAAILWPIAWCIVESDAVRDRACVVEESQ